MALLSHDDRKRLYIRIGIRFILLLAGIGVVTAIVPAMISLLLPFLIALLVGAALNPLVNYLNGKIRIPRGLLALFLDVLACSAIFGLIGWLSYIVISEAVSLASEFQSIWDYVVSGMNFLNDRMDWLSDLMPEGVDDIFANVQESVFVWAQSLSRTLMESIISLTATLTSKVGNVGLSFLISIMAVYFVITDYNKITAYVKRHTGNRFYRYFRVVKTAIASALGGYLRAQVLLALLAFFAMLVPLAIYGQKYAVLIALFLGVIDFLPIVGTAAILVPWGIFEIVVGDFGKGLFLLILAGGFFVLRKFVEPKIVGSQTGLHPLVALVSIYVGLKIFSIWGAIFGPLLVLLVMSVVKSGVFDNTFADIHDVVDDISGMLRRKEDGDE